MLCNLLKSATKIENEVYVYYLGHLSFILMID